MAWRNNTGTFLTLDGNRIVKAGVPGSPDILGLYRGAPLAVEVKTPSDRQRRTQEKFEAQWTQCGGIYLVARDPSRIAEQVQQARHEWTNRQRNNN